jgi:hypothetical protein
VAPPPPPDNAARVAELEKENFNYRERDRQRQAESAKAEETRLREANEYKALAETYGQQLVAERATNAEAATKLAAAEAAQAQLAGYESHFQVEIDAKLKDCSAEDKKLLAGLGFDDASLTRKARILTTYFSILKPKGAGQPGLPNPQRTPQAGPLDDPSIADSPLVKSVRAMFPA